MKTLKLNWIVMSVFFTALMLVMYVSGAWTQITKAAVSVFSPSTCYTASATTTLAYSAVTSTTTVTCALGPEGASSSVLIVEVNASSTKTAYLLSAEESMDGVDWFPVGFPISATTTNPIALGNGSLSLNFASSTVGGVANSTGLAGLDGSNNRNHYIVDIPVRMKRVRVYAGNTGISNGLGGIWMQIVPRENYN